MNTKITEIKNRRELTRTNHDQYGNPFQETIEYDSFESFETTSSGMRFLHYLIDVAISYGILIAFAFLLGIVLTLIDNNSVSNILETYLTLSFYIFRFSYYIVFEYFFQATIGKMICGSIVVDEYGERPKFKQIFYRTLSRIVPFEALSCLGDRPWHDSWTDTYVLPKKTLKDLLLKKEISELGNTTNKDIINTPL